MQIPPRQPVKAAAWALAGPSHYEAGPWVDLFWRLFYIEQSRGAVYKVGKLGA